MDRKMINEHSSCYVGLKASNVIVMNPKRMIGPHSLSNNEILNTTVIAPPHQTDIHLCKQPSGRLRLRWIKLSCFIICVSGRPLTKHPPAQSPTKQPFYLKPGQFPGISAPQTLTFGHEKATHFEGGVWDYKLIWSC